MDVIHKELIKELRDAIKRNCNLIILGSRGSGKSHFFKIFSEAKKKDDRVKVVFT